MEVKRDFTPAQIRILIRILNSQNKKTLNIASLARAIGSSPCNPPFLIVTRYLLQTGVLEQVGIIGSSKLVKVNPTKLCDLLDEQDHVNFMVDNYLAQWHVFSWRPGL